MVSHCTLGRSTTWVPCRGRRFLTWWGNLRLLDHGRLWRSGDEDAMGVVLPVRLLRPDDRERRRSVVALLCHEKAGDHEQARMRRRLCTDKAPARKCWSLFICTQLIFRLLLCSLFWFLCLFFMCFCFFCHIYVYIKYNGRTQR